MFEITPQERLALIALAVLLCAGAATRHLVARAQAADGLQYPSAAVDTSESDGASAHLAQVGREVELQRVRTTPLRPGERLDPNLAPAEQLARLPRIGPALAARIVAHREAHGPFRALEELRAVSGIGPALLETIAPHLELASAPPAGPRAASGGASGVDLNRASAAELQALPGIGPVIAERIVAYRLEHGLFRTFEDLEKVSGIGPRLRERLQSAARLGP